MHHWVVLIRTDYRIRVLSTRKWYRFILSKEGFQFSISLLIHFGKLVGEEAVLKFHFEVPSWYDWSSFFSFIWAIRERAFVGLSSCFIWINLTIPTRIMKSWKIKIHFDRFLTRIKFWWLLSRVALLYVAYPDPKVATLWIILLPLAPFPNLWIS